MHLIKILDIDLDFFLNEKETFVSLNSDERLDDSEFIPWKIKKVKQFLEKNCGLDSHKKTPGCFFIHHEEVFSFLRKIQMENEFRLCFSIDHIDAHADMGCGDSGYVEISSKILFENDIKTRANLSAESDSKLNSGNFLAYAIACRWIRNIKYINHDKWFNDLFQFYYKDYDFTTNAIQLKKYTPEQMYKIVFHGDFINTAKSIIPIDLEPVVSYECVEYNSFFNTDRYDFICLTQSPSYTPKSADVLIPLIKSYIEII